MSFREIKNSIIMLAPTAIMEEIYIEKLKKTLLFVSLKSNIRSLKVFDSERGLDELAEIRYSINGESVYISSFRVNEEYQQQGIGKLIFEYVLAHADAMGASRVYGTASPTDPIKGVSTGEDGSYEKEVQVIKNIYKRLGCRFIDDENFVQKWESKSKISRINPSVRKMIERVVKRDVSVM